jgi:polysaccharide biosynthesis transport protein
MPDQRPPNQFLPPSRLNDSPLAPQGLPPLSGGRQQYIEYPEQDLPADPHSGGLLEYWRIIQRRKGAVVLITVLGLLAAILFTLPQTPVYQARTTLEIQGFNADFMHMREVNPTSEGGSDYPEYDIQTQVHILQSETLASRVEKRLSAAVRPEPPESRVDSWRKALGIGKSRQGTSTSHAPVSFHVRAQTNTRLIELTADSTDPRLAADYLNTLSEEFIEQNLEARWQTAQHTGEWLTKQLEETKIKLEKSENALEDYSRHVGLLFTNQEKDNVAEQRLKQLQDELGRAQAERIARQARYELVSTASAESLGEVLDDANLKDVQGKLTELRRQQAELASTFTPSHPKVRRVEAQIQELVGALQRARTNILSRIRNDFQSAQRRESLLSTDYAGQVKLMAGQADNVAHYNILKREVDTNRQLYDNMLQRVKEAGVASALRASNIRTVDPADVPRAPYKPNLSTNAALGLLSGLFLGIVFVVFLERADRTVQEPGDAAFYTGVPELGLVPNAAVDSFNYRGNLTSHALTAGGAPQKPELVTLQRRPSAMAEAFRATLTSLLYTDQTGERPRVLVLSSAAPKEGKTTLATNLAIALAEIHQRVLLIDADLRKPRLHHVFELGNTTGLVNLLRHADPIVEPLNGHVQKTTIPNLSVMTSGRAHEGEASLLHSQRLSEVLAIVRGQFDTVVIDTPPMLTMSDARVIARHADAVVLVARANVTSRDSLRDACSRFAQDGRNVFGTVLNDWNPKRSSRYGYYRYYDRYKHYYAANKLK